jgi:AGCS family alanine or glycine:cation symporter
MQTIIDIIGTISHFIWGPWTFLLLMGVGILFTVWSKFIQFSAMTHGIQVVRGLYDNPDDPGAISHFQALAAALSATVGLGNIGGVALAIGLGGPGALFWMWIIGFLGMALKTIEVTLALMYRNTDDPENPHGGAMWVIEKTLGAKGGGYAKLARFLGGFFCVTLIISTMTGGNMFQSWNVAALTEQYFHLNPLMTSTIMAAMVGMVIIGGIKRIGSVAGKLVPTMVVMYVTAAFSVIAMHITEIPGLFALIIKSAFSPTEAGGAFVGAGVYFAFTVGLKRALFSNEAGQGSAPIAHCAAKTEYPAREGVVAGIGPFIDTLLICTLTAMVILCTNTWDREAAGEFDGALTISKNADAYVLKSAPHISQLPALEDGGSWNKGDGFYLIGEVPNNSRGDRQSNRVKFYGSVAKSDGSVAGMAAGELYVTWEALEINAAEWDTPPQQLRLLDNGVYRKYAGAQLTAHAFDREFPGLGKWMVTLAAWLFALSTMISWSYYGEQGVVYLVGNKGVLPYKVLFILLAVVAPLTAGNAAELGALIDFGTGAMLIANVPIILFMGHLAVKDIKVYFEKLDAGEFKRHR